MLNEIDDRTAVEYYSINGWGWTCKECGEHGGGYEHPDDALTVARAHADIHQLRRQFAVGGV